HRIDFTDRVASMTLVSNARFSMKLASGENATLRNMLVVRDLSSTEQQALRRAVETELGTSSVPDMTDIVLLVTEQTIGRHDDQTVGQLARFLEAIGAQVDALATHRAL